MIAAGVVLAWGITAMIWAFNRANVAPAAPVPGTVVADPSPLSALRGQTRYLYPLLTAVQTSCPRSPATLTLTDDPLPYQLGNYVLYPHYLEVINPLEPFDQAILTSHAGGCIFYYITGREQLAPFMGRLEEIACSEGGCLYRIEK
ncbi:MAG TPA: hypothetical protein VJ183_17585 [Chloroflexia bacterium]|nr:hypothetical protein [Chloroflexia bacterium]